MIDEQRTRLHTDPGDRRQRHLSAGGGGYVQGRERVDRAVRRRIRFENDAVLIRLREDRGDDSLPECVVERIVYGAHADAEPRGAVAVVRDGGGTSIVLLVADDVGELRTWT